MMFLIEISRFITEHRLIKLQGEIMRNVPFGPIKEHTCPSGTLAARPAADLPKEHLPACKPDMQQQGLLITALLSTRHGVSTLQNQASTIC